MTEPRFDGIRVLVAEDELLLAMDLTDRLREVGCEVIGPARTLAAATALAETPEHIDLALLDLNLAGESALALAQRMGAANVPVILTTGYDHADLQLDLSAVRICVKPIASGLLLRTMDDLLAYRTKSTL